MEKIFACILILLITYSKVFAAIPEYDTISPINLTILYSGNIDDVKRERITEAMRHFAVAVYEKTNGAHQLGRIKIIQRGELEPKELMHIHWFRYSRATEIFGGRGARTGRIGSYIPFSQNVIRRGGIQINLTSLDGAAFSPADPVLGPIDTGYTLAHETGHFIYGLFDEYPGSLIWSTFSRIWGPQNISPYDGLAPGMNSIMHTQRRAVVSVNQRERALALNFSTNRHYRLDAVTTGIPIIHRTAQRRMYPYTISAWDTLVENVAPMTSRASRSLFRDLRRVYPVGYMDITHTREALNKSCIRN